MTRFAFKLGAVLKIVFVATVIGIALYHEYGFKKTEIPTLFEKLDLRLDIQLPFYIHLLAIFIPIAYFLNLIVLNLFAFLPCLKISRYFLKPYESKIIYALEILLLIALSVVAFPKIEDAFEQKDYGLLGAYLERFVDAEESAKLRLIDKLEALNYLLPILASVLVLTSFWQIRRKNQARCNEVFTEN